MSDFFEQRFIALCQRGIRFEPDDTTVKPGVKLLLGENQLTEEEQQWCQDNKTHIVNLLANSKISALSISQERLWYLDQIGFGFQYHIPTLAKVSGHIDIDILKRTLQAIISRHESLRCNFFDLAGFPLQHIYIERNLDFSVIDEKDDARSKNILSHFFDRPFDLQHDSLLRVLLIRHSSTEYKLAVSKHHIISDGWSMQIFLRELSQYYQAYQDNSPLDIKPVRLQHSGYCAWQQYKRMMDTEDEYTKHGIDFWRQKLKHYQDLNLSSDYSRPSRPSGMGAIHRISISHSLWSKIDACSRDLRSTPLCLFSAAVYLLLGRYAGHMNFCLGMPVANRTEEELEDLIGFFVNTLIIKPDINESLLKSNDYLTRDFLLAMRQALLEAQEFQSLPIEKVIDKIQPERQLGTNPIFQVLINYARINRSTLALGDASLTPSLDLDAQSAKFDLSFSLNEFVGGDKIIFIEYASDIFKAQTIENYGQQLQVILEELVERERAPLNTIRLMNSMGQSQIRQFSQGKQEHSGNIHAEQSLAHLFSACAERYHNNIALFDQNGSMSYAELNERSTRLAQYLQENILCQYRNHDQQPIVAIACKRSADLVVAVLATLKASAAFLPVDLSSPDKPLLAMLSECHVKLLLTQSVHLERLDSISAKIEDLHCVCLDTIYLDTIDLDTVDDELKRYSSSVQIEVKPEDLAYINYTSGSTGKPKGVMVEHRNAVNHCFAAIDIYHLKEEDKVMQFSNPCFDIFIEELFPTLISGATLVLLDEVRLKDPSFLQTACYEHKITVMNLPTAYWHLVAENEFQAPFLRLVVIGGEAVQTKYWQQWNAAHPNIPVVNTYGPTETTVIASYFSLNNAYQVDGAIPIGKPIPGVNIYILDEYLHPVPLGVPGNIFIGGKGVARGYVGDIALTEQRFINDPFCADGITNGRMYNSGDRGCWLADGNIRFLGRSDNQFKIRGYRIEPTEIEAALRELSFIDDAIVLAVDHLIHSRENANNTTPEKVLLAFIRGMEANKTSQIRQQIKETLPQHLQPRLYIPIDSYPLTPRGKVDKHQLQQLGQKHLQGNVDTQRPTADSEGSKGQSVQQALLGIWQQLLGTNDIHPDDDFYQVGGHSLLSVQLVRQINNHFTLTDEQQVRVFDIIQNPSVDALAALIEERTTANTAKTTQAGQILKMKSADISIILPGMPGLVEGYYELAQAISDGSEVVGINMCGYNNDAPLNSIEAMAQYNIEQIKQHRRQGRLHIYAHSYGGTVALCMLNKLKDSPYEIGNITFIDSSLHRAQASIDKSSLILFFKTMLKQDELSQDIELSINHLITNTPYERWPRAVSELLATQSVKIEADIFEDIWRVVDASISASSPAKLEKQAQSLRLVIAEQSREWLSSEAWQPYFEQVNVEYVPGNHHSIVRAPSCTQWLTAKNLRAEN